MKMATAVQLTRLHDPGVVDRALGEAAAAGRFADGDLAAILTHQAQAGTGPVSRASEDHTLAQGTTGRSGGPEDARGPVAARITEFLGVKAGQLGAGRAKLRGSIDIVTLQTLSRRDDVAELTAGYGLIVADECHHVPATAFEHAVKQVPARRWLGLTATPYRRDKLDDLIAMQVGPVRHTIALSRGAAGQDTLPGTGRPRPVLYVHLTAYRYDGDADPSRPGGMTTIYRHLAADEQRTRQVTADVIAALSMGRNCLVLTNRTGHLERLGGLLREAGHDPVVLRGGMGAKSLAAALARLQPQPAAHRSWPWPPAHTLAKASTAGPGHLVPSRASCQ